MVGGAQHVRGSSNGATNETIFIELPSPTFNLESILLTHCLDLAFAATVPHYYP